MFFCTVCSNKYFIRISEDDPNTTDTNTTLIYYCKQCGNEDTNITCDNNCVFKTSNVASVSPSSKLINKYTKLDPTLPRITGILCPNQSCETNTKKIVAEIIYFRYDDSNMRYMYLCTTCDHCWNNTDVM